jgi:hypothetical protein
VRHDEGGFSPFGKVGHYRSPQRCGGLRLVSQVGADDDICTVGRSLAVRPVGEQRGTGAHTRASRHRLPTGCGQQQRIAASAPNRSPRSVLAQSRYRVAAAWADDGWAPAVRKTTESDAALRYSAATA